MHIDGETILSTHDVYHDDKMFSSQALKQEMPSFPALQQAGVRYRWDGEEAFGMLERVQPVGPADFLDLRTSAQRTGDTSRHGQRNQAAAV